MLLFTGAHTFAELGPAWTDRFISARRVRVSFLKLDEVHPLLTKPIPEFDLTYAAGALEALMDATRGQPYLTQALESGGEYFANVWTDAGASGQAILREVDRGQTSRVAADVRRLQSQSGGSESLLTSAATGALKWLREHDGLNEAGQFAVPMMERWVREKCE